MVLLYSEILGQMVRVELCMQNLLLVLRWGLKPVFSSIIVHLA